MRRLLLVVVFALAVSASAIRAQSPPAADTQDAVKALQDRVAKLELVVRELQVQIEARSTASSARAAALVEVAANSAAPGEAARNSASPSTLTASTVAPSAAPAPNPPESVTISSAAKANTESASSGMQMPGMQNQPPPSVVLGAEHPSYPSLQIRGFGDVDFSATDQHGSHSGFSMGQFVLHFSSSLSPKVSVFAETSFTAEPDAPYNLEVERAIIRYDYNDNFKLSFGRYHTPVNYWNTAFHHGSWLQTTISRPEMVKFGGTFIPVHFVGALAEGSIPSGGLGLNYNVGVGNGRSSVISRAGDAGDANNNRAWVVNLFARPARFYGLQVGGSVYRDEITLPNGHNFREWISAAHFVWFKETPEFIAEFANVNHEDELTSRTFNSQAFYVQVADRLPWFEKEWKPYYRFEYIHIPNGEPVFVATTQDLVGSTLGVRYDITNYAAFKAEYRYTKHGVNEPYVNGVFFQTAFTF
jgi:hypothetical protein